MARRDAMGVAVLFTATLGSAVLAGGCASTTDPAVTSADRGCEPVAGWEYAVSPAGAAIRKAWVAEHCKDGKRTDQQR